MSKQNHEYRISDTFYMIKEDGEIRPGYGFGPNYRDMVVGYLLQKKGLVVCRDPDCDCAFRALDERAPGVKLVPVKFSEIKVN